MNKSAITIGAWPWPLRRAFLIPPALLVVADFKKTLTLFAIILIPLISSGMAGAGQLYSYRERIIICMVSLVHADAEQLADVLTPFLSPQGKISAYSPTNTLIIKDQTSVVMMLIKAIKGRADLSECQNLDHVPEIDEKSNGS